MAGPRRALFFQPGADLRAGIVTCGGLCPGINDVIRALVLSLNHHYGVRTIYGFRYGYEGLNRALGHEPLLLTPEMVERISMQGGTLLGTARGNQDVAAMVDTLVAYGVNILFTIGGDGTLRGAQAIAAEIARRQLPIAVAGGAQDDRQRYRVCGQNVWLRVSSRRGAGGGGGGACRSDRRA